MNPLVTDIELNVQSVILNQSTFCNDGQNDHIPAAVYTVYALRGITSLHEYPRLWNWGKTNNVGPPTSSQSEQGGVMTRTCLSIICPSTTAHVQGFGGGAGNTEY